jgi:hypothetical protein
VKEIKNKCSREKIVVIWYDECLLRYSNRSFFSTVDEKPRFWLLNRQNFTDGKFELFNKLLNMTMLDLAREISSNVPIGKKKFGTKEVIISAFQILYYIVQYTPNLNSTGCNSCLLAAINLLSWCCSGKLGCRIVFPSCNIRYQFHPFYRMAATAPTPSPEL